MTTTRRSLGELLGADLSPTKSTLEADACARLAQPATDAANRRGIAVQTQFAELGDRRCQMT